ncbi:MAG: DUF642 domain-containing protein [Gammaproteobacteria bacterium]|nr:DUF642 domain-containing protein [Gammaproteobacteria bacterium]
MINDVFVRIRPAPRAAAVIAATVVAMALASTSARATAVLDYGLNLLENPSFESHPKIKRNRLEVFPHIPGWTSFLEHVPLRDGNSGSIDALDGDTKLDLDALYNTEVSQEIDTVPGQRYQLELFYAPRYQRSGTGTNDIEVLWDDEVVALLGGDVRYWRRHLVDLQAFGARSRLGLRGAGASDGRGGLVDMLSVLEVPYLTGNLIDNGSFEDDAGRDHARGKKHDRGDDIPGWRTRGDDVELERHGSAGVSPYEGEVLLSLDGREDDAVSQILSLEPGAWYELEVFYSPRRSSGKDAIAVELDDVRLGIIAGERKEWQRRRFTFQAGSDAPTLTLSAPRCADDSKHRGRRDCDDDRDDDRHHGKKSKKDDEHERDGRSRRDDDDDRDHDHKHGKGKKDDDDDDRKGKPKRDDDDDDDDDDRGNSASRGGFVDNVRLYGVCRASGNLIVNHSFEAHGSIRGDGQGTFLSIPGWRADAGIIEIHVDGFGGRSLMAAEGIAHVELGGDGDRAIIQDVPTEPGARYELAFAYSPRIEKPGTDRNDLEVHWDGERLATLSGERKGWQFHRFTVTASGALTELRFVGVGAREGKGAQLDEVRLFRAADIIDIVSDPVTTAEVGAPYAYQVLLSAPAGASFTLAEAPDGMTVDGDGLVRWPLPEEGEHPIVIEVRDDCGSVVTQSYTLTVVDASNSPPTITSTPETTTALFAVHPLVSVDDATATTTVILLNGEPYVPGTPISADGDYTLTVRATDAAGNVSDVEIDFRIDRSQIP